MTTPTKYCTKCKQRKPVTEFHRYGLNDYQRHCKQCRLEYARKTHNKKHAPHPKKEIDVAMLQQNGERLARLAPRLRLISSHFGRDPMQADDMYSFIVEKLFTSIRPEDKDSYVLAIAKKRAIDFIRSERTYTFYVDAEDKIAVKRGKRATGENAYGIKIVDSIFDFFVSEQGTGPEDALNLMEFQQQIKAVICDLDPENRRIAVMIIDGVKKSQIAKELGVSGAAISQRIKNMRSVFSSAMELT